MRTSGSHGGGMRTVLALSLLVPAALGAAVLQVAVPRSGGSPSPPTSPAASSPPSRGAGPVSAAASTAPGPPAAGHATSLPGRRWGWPLNPRPQVTHRFERPAHQWSAGHRGVDLLASPGQPVLAAGDGIVGFVGTVAGRGVVSLRHAGGWRTTYEPVAATVAIGDVVRRGDRIGTVAGTPGHCAPATCLHWGALLGQDYRDPLALLLPRRIVLLPLS